MLARKYRFHGHGSLSYVFRHGHTVRGKYVVLRFIKNERRPRGRVGVIVSKKVSKFAVVRNRIRRRIFEAVRAHQTHIKAGYDIVFVTLSPELAGMPSDELMKDITTLMKRAAIWGNTGSQSD